MKPRTLVIGGAAVAAPGVLVLAPVMMMGMLLTGGNSQGTTLAGGGLSRCTLTRSQVSVADLAAEQVGNARTIIAVGQQFDVPARGWVIALAAALQESGLRNLQYGDRDSLGLFQQRPSAGWGTPKEVTTPTYAARAFYGGPTSPTPNPGLLDLDGWRRMPLWQAAQTVQRSAFPMAYAQHEQLATALVHKLAGTVAGCAPLASGTWTLPIAGRYVLTSNFGPRISPTGDTAGFHTGLDFAAPLGTPVHAVASGIVLAAGPSGSGYGNLIRIRHGNGVQSWYAHLSAASVTPGSKVRVGEVLGAVGSTGNSTGPHLHLEIRLDDQPTDPHQWLRQKGLTP